MVKLTKREKLRKKVTKSFSRDEQKPGQPKLATTTLQMPAASNGVSLKQTHQQSAIKLKSQMYSPKDQSKKTTITNNKTTATKSSAIDNPTKLNNNASKIVVGDSLKEALKQTMGKPKKSNKKKFSPYAKPQGKDNKPNQTMTSKDIKPTMIELKFNQAQGGDAAASVANKRQTGGQREKAGTTSNGIYTNGNTSSSANSSPLNATTSSANSSPFNKATSSSANSSPSKAPLKKTQKFTNLQNSNRQVNNNKLGNGSTPKVPLKRPALAKKPKVQQKRMKLSCQETQKQKKDVPNDSSSDSYFNTDSDTTNSTLLMEKYFPSYVRGGDFDTGESSDDDDDDEEYSMTCSSDNNEYHPFNDHYQYDDDFSCTEIETDDLSSEDKCYGSSPEHFNEDNDEDEFDFLNHIVSDVYDDSSDGDYIPPTCLAEDLIIHNGTATKYEIPKDEPVLLCSDNDEPHVVEFETEETKVISIKQPKGFDIDALNKLNEMFEKVKIDLTINLKEKNDGKEEVETDDSPCPQLVPITESDLESFLQTDDSFDEHYEEMSEVDSLISEDIHAKYMKSDEVSNCFDSDDDNKPSPITVSMVIAQKSSIVTTPIKFNSNDYLATPTPMEEDFPNFEITNSNAKITNVRTMKKPNFGKLPLPTFSQDSFKSAVGFESPSISQGSPLIGEAAFSPTSEMSTHEKSTQSRNIFCNAINSNDVLVLLKDEIYIYGTVCLTMLYGTTDVYGYKPEKLNAVEIFSPRGCSLVQVTPKQHGEIGKSKLESILEKYEDTFTRANLQEVVKKYTPGVDAVLLLQRNNRAKKLISNFKKFMSENVFPNMKSLPTDRPNYTSEYLLQCFINNDSDKGLQVSPEWQNIKLNDQTKMLLAGGKSVGKSTLLRYLVNRNLKQFPRILIIDLDIGQSELFVPQTVSCTVVKRPLLGPGFFLNYQPDKAFLVGHVNVALCAETYMRAVKELLAYCHSQLEYADLPWLINTMGYNKGFGLELFACVADYVRPTDIVQLQSNKDINNFSMPLERNALKSLPRIIFGAEEFKTEESVVEPTCKLHVLYSAVMQQSRYQKEWDMSAKDLRYAMLIARLSGALQGNAEWLTDCIPLIAPLDSIKFVNMMTREGTRDELLAAVETNLVYLCQVEANTNAPVECFGIGIVRGIDHNVNQVYLVPATFYNRLHNVNCLALGEMPLPNSLFINQGPKVRGTAPFVYSTVDANASKAVKQIYSRPAEFLTGVHREI